MVMMSEREAELAAARAALLAEDQAKRLGWTRAQAGAVGWAVAGRLHRHADGSYARLAPDRAVLGDRGRRVAAARVEQLIRAGFLDLSLPDGQGEGGGPVRASADGRRAWQVWLEEQPEPAAAALEAKTELRPLYGGELATRRHREWQAELARVERERAAWWAETERRFAEQDREEALDAAWRQAEGIRNPSCKRPADWTPEQAAEKAKVQRQREEEQRRAELAEERYWREHGGTAYFADAWTTADGPQPEACVEEHVDEREAAHQQPGAPSISAAAVVGAGAARLQHRRSLLSAETHHRPRRRIVTHPPRCGSISTRTRDRTQARDRNGLPTRRASRRRGGRKAANLR